MESWRRELYTNELYHHGIVGQKWGVRRFQDYNGKRIGSSIFKRSERRKSKDDLVFDDMYEKREFDSLDDVPRLSKPMAASKSATLINPGFPGEGTTENCVMCTAAMAMREKGYDVRAANATTGLYQYQAESLFDELKYSGKVFKKSRYFDGLNALLSNEGEGAYGGLTIYWKSGGAHNVFWKNEEGVPRIYDSQAGEEISMEDIVKWTKPECHFSRMDNLPPSEKVLAVIKGTK